MVSIEIRSTGLRFSIDRGQIVDGDREYSLTVRELADVIRDHSDDGELDYSIAQEFVAMYGGRIIEPTV